MLKAIKIVSLVILGIALGLGSVYAYMLYAALQGRW